jgi:hypothetical protein
VGRRTSLDEGGKSRPHRDSIPGPSKPVATALPRPTFTVRQESTFQISLPRTAFVVICIRPIPEGQTEAWEDTKMDFVSEKG